MFSVDVESGLTRLGLSFVRNTGLNPAFITAPTLIVATIRAVSRRSKSYKIVLSLRSVVSLDLTAESSMIRTE